MMVRERTSTSVPTQMVRAKSKGVKTIIPERNESQAASPIGVLEAIKGGDDKAWNRITGLVSIGFEFKGHVCGGSIIESNIVMTAKRELTQAKGSPQLFSDQCVYPLIHSSYSAGCATDKSGFLTTKGLFVDIDRHSLSEDQGVIRIWPERH